MGYVMSNPCKHWFEGMVARSETICPFCEIAKLKTQSDEALAEVERVKALCDEYRENGERLMRIADSYQEEIAGLNSENDRLDEVLNGKCAEIETLKKDDHIKGLIVADYRDKWRRDEELLHECLDQLESAHAGSILRDKLRERLGL
jgi:chromosome segregation ATPase